ncbi:MAG: cation:proton antiporter, partial [Candidatus Omnitrophica bacterium]|nr:cation:proton antiporter [Candidatus Omnitrophota bacterium]
NFSLAATIAATLISHQQLSLYSSVLKPLMIIGGSVLLGAVFGFIFNILTAYIKKETEGFFIVLIFALLPICFGLATLLNADELLSTMTMGIVVVNFNVKRDKIFRVLERYTEELIFVLFFTLSGMHLNFAVLKTVLIPVFLFVAFRTAGKFLGVFTGAALAHSSLKIKKYTAAGLIPQGGIVIGLALLIKQTPEFNSLADIIISITIGATVIHELIGPVLSTMAIKKAGEI